MNCIKCGREIDSDHVFCSSCLETMERFPVKQDTVIRLPNRNDTGPKKAAPRKRAPTAEQKLARMKKKCRWQRITIFFLTLLLLMSVAFSFYYVKVVDINRFMGQNYSTVETTK